LLTNAAKDIADLIAYSTFNDMELKIEGAIQISLVPIKKNRTSCLNSIVIKRHHFISSKTNDK
jgi:hypothetical protein